MNLITADIKTKTYSFEDFFVKSFKIFFKNFLELTLPYLIIMIPVMFFTYNYMTHFADMQMQMTTSMGNDPGAIFKYLGQFFSRWFLFILASILLMSLYKPYLILRVRTIVESDGATIGASFKETLSVYPGFLVTYILTGIMIIVSFFICCIPVLFISIGIILAAPAAALDRRYFHLAVGDSFSMLSGRYWKTFGFFILLYIVCISAIMFAIMPFYFVFIGSTIIHSISMAKNAVDPAAVQRTMMKQMYHSISYWIFMGGAMILGGMMRGILITAQTLIHINYKNVPATTKVIETKPSEPAVQA